MTGQTWESWAYLPDLAGAQAPRYTSYPPANRFGNDVGADDVIASVQELSPDTSLSIYLHIPFCHQLCWYCGCHTSVPTRANPLDPYVEMLLEEIELVGELAGRKRVSHVHFGGGSPNILSPEQIDAIFGRLREQFDIDPEAEICVEMDPRSVSQASVSAFAGNGLTRASLGVQVLDGKVQALINRIQPRELVSDVVMRLRDAGVGSINMDVMYGLPDQTHNHVLETVDYALACEADRVAVFGYAHVPWFKKHQGAIRTARLPSGEVRFRQAEAAAQRLSQAGYIQCGFDHYARPGDAMAAAASSGGLRRNFQGFTTDAADALLGFGASAISSVGRLHYQNCTSTAQYRQRIAAQCLPVARGARLSDRDAEIGRAISEIMCRLETEAPATLTRYGMQRLRELQRLGIVDLDDAWVRVTKRGRPYVRQVAMAFDPNLPEVAGRHSLAV